MVTFYRHKQKIYTKLNELSRLCGVDVGFLVYSNSGIAYTFSSPSFEVVANRFLNEKMEELCKVYNSISEKADAEKQKGMAMAKAEAETLPVEKDT
ncbi:PREDICTED: agamous-like MADS-box protein AGL29 [Camelina sativa]|uniref:Agamous-like MADS-box protein AGL29 n=1 Tax=Camelina sativa TaxID=90675 RepID=A0ABM1RAE8_CAMSA|nr:PREDICTED: agamous-like MADS-box protein AGL29 [Camelina sativa]